MCLTVVSVLLKIRFGHAQISVPKISILMSTAFINPYIDQIPIAYQNQKFHLLNDQEKHNLGSMIGSINWLATQTQRSVSFDVLDLSLFVNKQSTVLDLLKTNYFRRLDITKVNLFTHI